jgi:hypothetical protein
VNGVEVGSFVDESLVEGKVGLSVVTYANGPVGATFANLGVWSILP